MINQQSIILHDKWMIYLITNHLKLNKFHGFNNKNFCLMKTEIQRMTQTAFFKIKTKYCCMIFFLCFLLCSLSSNFLQIYSMKNKKDFHVNFNLKNIFVMNKFVTRNVKIKQLKNELLSISMNKIRRKVFILHELDTIEKIQFFVKFV